MKLNLGCGFNKREGYLNVDREPLCAPDQIVDLERFPWPWEDDTFSEILADHALEHLGASVETWLGVVRELWRVSAPGALLQISVPHPNHENFMHDPTHVRVITPVGIAMFDQMRNIRDFENGGQETKLGLFSGIDLEVVDVGYDLSEPWRSRYVSGEWTREQVEAELLQKNNVCIQIRINARVIKPARGAAWIAARTAQRGLGAGASPGVSV